MAKLRGFIPEHTDLKDPANKQIVYDAIERMDETLLHNWNKIVEPGDTVYHLGDFAFSPANRIEYLLMSLKGQIHALVGNHDTELKKALKRNPRLVAWTGDYKEIKVGEQFIVLNHYPYLVWNKSHYDSWNLHGHCHGSLPVDMNAKRLDVGVDSVGAFGAQPFTPISFAEVDRIMAGRKFVPIDRHGDY
jgi:calcineurin-like phosphoesterase family protein